MRHGTQELASAPFAQALDRMGLRMGGGVAIDTSIVSISGLIEHLWTAVDLATQLALAPGLEPTAVAGERIKVGQIHRHAWSRVESMVTMWLARGLFGDHPYGTPITLADGAAATTREDLLELHSAIANPARGLVLVVGDVDPERVVVRLADRLSRIEPAQAAPQGIQSPIRTPRPRLVFIENDQAEQACIGLGLPAIPRHHPDYLPLKVANQVFGGSASSRLFAELRDRKSLTYGAYSNLDCGLVGGDTTASLSCAPDKAGPAFAGLISELEAMGEGELKPAEVDHAKQFLMGSFPQRAAGLTGVASLVTSSWLHGLGNDAWVSYQERVDGVSLDMVQRAARKWFQPASATFAVAGPAGALESLRAAVQPNGLPIEVQTMDDLMAPETR
jgi:predicted Zn-dependent peptidase